MAELLVSVDHYDLPHVVREFMNSAAKRKLDGDSGPNKRTHVSALGDDAVRELASGLADLPAFVLVKLVNELSYDDIETLCMVNQRLAWRVCGQQKDGDKEGYQPLPQIWRNLLARDFGLASTPAQCTHPYLEARNKIAAAVRELVDPLLQTDDIRTTLQGYREFYRALLAPTAKSTSRFAKLSRFADDDIIVRGQWRGLLLVHFGDVFGDSYIVPLPTMYSLFVDKAMAQKPVSSTEWFARWSLTGDETASNNPFFNTFMWIDVRASFLVTANGLVAYSENADGWKSVDVETTTRGMLASLGLQVPVSVDLMDTSSAITMAGNFASAFVPALPLREPTWYVKHAQMELRYYATQYGFIEPATPTIGGAVTFLSDLFKRETERLELDSVYAPPLAILFSRDVNDMWQHQIVPDFGIAHAVNDAYAVDAKYASAGREVQLFCLERATGRHRWLKFTIDHFYGTRAWFSEQRRTIAQRRFQVSLDTTDTLHFIIIERGGPNTKVLWSRLQLSGIVDGMRNVDLQTQTSIVSGNLLSLVTSNIGALVLTALDGVLSFNDMYTSNTYNYNAKRLALHINSERAFVMASSTPWSTMMYRAENDDFDILFTEFIKSEDPLLVQTPEVAQLIKYSAKELTIEAPDDKGLIWRDTDPSN